MIDPPRNKHLQYTTSFVLFVILLSCGGLFRIIHCCNHHDHDHHNPNYRNDTVAAAAATTTTTITTTTSDDHHHMKQQHHHHGRHRILQQQTTQPTLQCGFRSPSIEEKELDKKLMEIWHNSQDANSIIYRRYTIPVYFHVIQPFFLIGAVSNYVLRYYIKSLNNAYKNAPFLFIHGGTTRTFNWNWSYNCDNRDVELAMKSLLKVGFESTLNVYICSKVGAYAGYAYLPRPNMSNVIRDGVVMLRGNDADLTLIHEVGHFLGLLHTFDGNNCSPTNENDLVNDTAQHLSKTDVTCRTFFPDTCPNLPGFDPVYNYMTYTADWSCYRQFTEGQIERMLGQYELYRLGNGTHMPSTAPSISTSPTVVPPCKRIFQSCQSNHDCCNGRCGILLNFIRRCGIF